LPQPVTASHLPLRHLALVLVACGLALLINPYGSRMWSFPFEMQADWIRANGREWQAPFGNAGWRDVGGGLLLSVEPLFWLYVAAVGAVLLARLRQWRTADLVPVAIMGLWLMLSLRHLRAVSDAVLMTAPCVAAGMPSFMWSTRRWPARVATGFTVGLALLSVPSTLSYVESWTQTDAPRTVCLATAIERHELSGRVFSNYLNGWLLYRFHPKLLVGATWEYVAGARRWAELRAATRNGAEGLHPFLMRHQVDVVVLTTSAQDDALTYIPVLLKRGWVVIHTDGYATVLVPQRPDMATLIAREGYHWLVQPVKEPSTPAHALELLEEANRALQHCPTADFAWPYKAFALRMLGFHEEAFAVDLHVIAR
jgi:hypothetical protein